MLKRFFPLILSSLLLALALPAMPKISSQSLFAFPRQRRPNFCSKRSRTTAAHQRTPSLLSLSYARAKDVQEALAPHFGSKLSLDNITNSLILLGDEQCHARLKQLLPKLDIPTRQVTLEAKIIAVSREDSKTWAYAGTGTLFPRASRKRTTVTVTAAIMTAALNFGAGLPSVSTLRLMLS